MTREEIAIRAWDHGFWFATLRILRTSGRNSSRVLAYRCAELIGHDRYLLKVDSRQPGGKDKT